MSVVFSAQWEEIWSIEDAMKMLLFVILANMVQLHHAKAISFIGKTVSYERCEFFVSRLLCLWSLAGSKVTDDWVAERVMDSLIILRIKYVMKSWKGSM